MNVGDKRDNKIYTNLETDTIKKQIGDYFDTE